MPYRGMRVPVGSPTGISLSGRPVAAGCLAHEGSERVSVTTQEAAQYAVRAVDLWKKYGTGEAEVIALKGVNVALERGRFTAIMGPSGSGKSTLMHCLAGLDTVSRGEVHIGDTPL